MANPGWVLLPQDSTHGVNSTADWGQPGPDLTETQGDGNAVPKRQGSPSFIFYIVSLSGTPTLASVPEPGKAG